MMFKRRHEEDLDAQAINISPLIDVIFILLIFFIMTMAFADSEAMKVDVPKTINSNNISEEFPVVVIRADSSFVVDGSVLDYLSLKRVLAKKLGVSKNLVIRADSQVSVEKLVEVMDCAKGLGAAEIFVSTQKK